MQISITDHHGGNAVLFFHSMHGKSFNPEPTATADWHPLDLPRISKFSIHAGTCGNLSAVAVGSGLGLNEV